MAIPERTEETVSQLAEEVLDSWDIGTLMEYAKERLEDAYWSEKDLFQMDWVVMFGGDAEDVEDAS